MLSLPSAGFARSVNSHNVDLEICCDWLEACALFDQGAVTRAEIADFLHDSEIYPSQDFAWEFLSNVWDYLTKRSLVFGKGYPLRLLQKRLEKAGDWKDYPAYSFCLVLSLAECFPTWANLFGNDYTEQGELFEALTTESISRSLLGWKVHATGWTRKKPSQLAQVVGGVAALLNEKVGDLAWWTSPNAHEEGLDLLCFRSFVDERVGLPAYLFQCASGRNWKEKRKTPDMAIWRKAIIFATDPKKAFAIPFALSDKDFRTSCAAVEGLLLDRCRLLYPGHSQSAWVSKGLTMKLVKWIRPRIKRLLKEYKSA
jgi:hypothetical protein